MKHLSLSKSGKRRLMHWVLFGVACTTFGLGCVVTDAVAATWTVSTLADNAPGDPVVENSLRWAIIQCNDSMEDENTIVFTVAGTIYLAAELDALEKDGTVILGDTAPGDCEAFTSPHLHIDGGGVIAYGLRILADDCAIRGLVIRNFERSLSARPSVHGGGEHLRTQPNRDLREQPLGRLPELDAA